MFPWRWQRGRAAAAGARAAPAPFLGLPVSGFGTIRAQDVDFGVPIELPEIAPGGVQAADPSGARAELGARILARYIRSATTLLTAMKAAP